jgi:hypothetical protein
MVDPEFQEHFRHPRTPYTLRNGLLHFNEKVCVPTGNTRLSLLHDTHDIPSTGHLGFKKTAARLSTKYHWKSLKNTVQDYVKSCDICQHTKNSTQKPFELLQPLSVPTHKRANISMDFINPLPKTARAATPASLLLSTASVSSSVSLPHPQRWTPQRSPDYFIIMSIDTTDFLLRLCLIVIPYLWANSGLPFPGCSVSSSAHSSAYHPETDGQTEVVNRKVEEILRCFVNNNQSNWDLLLIDLEFA